MAAGQRLTRNPLTISVLADINRSFYKLQCGHQWMVREQKVKFSPEKSIVSINTKAQTIHKIKE